MNFLPISLNIENKKILIVGGGSVALNKATILSRFTDSAVVVSPVFLPEFDKLPFKMVRKEFSEDDLNGAFLVYICTGNRELNAGIKKQCAVRNVLASVCDDPRSCDFISPAIYKEGNITISVGSNGENVKRSIRIRDNIREFVEKNKIKLD
ncbi:MAG: bifunctional precorrin-2 dehydrogenase/sirohydrochlorin ferrochelatase [Rikenellaceae bacterium]|nr:bifunctional precorrin-2 dehydrogenase/sirohydrochlorin ferrochelatase [Rikenellaceae bacterium]